jgi:hypothetical protein
MGELQNQADWYYVGHYGQLGPLTFEQVSELARDGVISPDTFVWKPGMRDWLQAQDVADLRPLVAGVPAELLPPPMPTSLSRSPAPPAAPMAQTYAPSYSGISQSSWTYLEAGVPKSDKNRVTAGLLNLLPGFGRFYMGYAAHGALQLVTAFLCGIGFVWSIVDGIYILMGGVKYDGYGRVLQD